MAGGIYVWGTGCGAGELMGQGLQAERIEGFIDSSPSAPVFMGREVIRPEQLPGREYELIIVTSRRADEIANRANELGIPGNRLLFLKNIYRLIDENRSYETAEQMLGGELLSRLISPVRMVREPVWLESGRLETQDMDNDYVRMATLEAVCRELGEVTGAAAELGVYKGGFARCINALLPERTLYLFDTFQGFDEAEADRERDRGRLGNGMIEAHRNTGPDRVLSLMPHPETVEIRQGLFPASLRGLEERFALVSIDVDLEDSIYAGLEYFVPRLSHGGYIFLHDFNSPKLLGVRAALRRYERDRGRRLPAVPLCDQNGSLVICG